jgi:hypothetical protein
MASHHIIALLAPAWGHTISYINIATQMLQRDPKLVITIVQHNVLGTRSCTARKISVF